MNDIIGLVILFFKEMLVYSMIAIFLQNTIFSRGLGTSTVLYIVRKKYNIFKFFIAMTGIITSASIIVYFINPFFYTLENKYYVTPLIFAAVIGVVYILALVIISYFDDKLKNEMLPIIHISAFNCATLGGVILSTSGSDLRLSKFIGFGIGTGIGFTLATYFLSVAYKQLNSERIPKAFRGFPITLIYIGIISLSLYGLIGHELLF